MTFKSLFGPITKLSSSFVTFRVSRFPVSYLTYETFNLHLQNTLNMSKTTRVYFGVLQISNVLLSGLDSETFWDNAKGSVLGLGSLKVLGLPKLRDVLLVSGLKANLISISQLCDQDLFLKFTKDKGIVIDQDQHNIMEGNRT